jgi:hypothetical protein
LNIEQLSQNIINCRILKSRHRILERGADNDKICLAASENGWKVYYGSERGGVYDLKQFSNQEEACAYFWALLQQDSHNRKLIEAGRVAGLVSE